jgi:alkyl hydroperoxide reductase subunit AhpF
MLDANLKAQLGAAGITNPVEIVASLDDTPASASLRERAA